MAEQSVWTEHQTDKILDSVVRDLASAVIVAPTEVITVTVEVIDLSILSAVMVAPATTEVPKAVTTAAVTEIVIELISCIKSLLFWC